MNRYLNVLGAVCGYTMEIVGIVMLESTISRNDSSIEDLVVGASMYVFGRAINNARLSQESDDPLLQNSTEKPRYN